MSKWQQFKHAVANPQPEHLAKIEYRSHFLSMFGITLVSLILIFKGYWYVIFAFIFQIGTAYAQGMSAVQRYRLIKEFQNGKPETLRNILKDKSFTRRRQRVIAAAYGSAANWLCLCASFGIAILQYLAKGMSVMPFIYFITIYFITYYLIAYNFAYKKLKRRKRGN